MYILYIGTGMTPSQKQNGQENEKMSQAISTTILEQLGGMRFMAMVGGYNARTGGMDLTVNFRGSSAANCIRIELDAAQDLYTVTFYKLRGAAVRVVEELAGVFAGDLRQHFERVTGLYTSLGTCGR